MDQYVPEGQRRQGLALAEQIERKAGNAGRPMRVARNEPGPRTVLPPNTALGSTLPAERPMAAAPSRRGSAPLAESETPAPVAVHRGAPSAVAVHHGPPPPSEETHRAAPVAVAASEGRWRIQLGAFSSAANAHRAWESIRGKGLGGLQPVYTPAGAMTRLQAGPLASKAAAEKACAAAKAAGSACFPVAP
jgi:cell division septation protein DedD